jgi:hypothetical protein
VLALKSCGGGSYTLDDGDGDSSGAAPVHAAWLAAQYIWKFEKSGAFTSHAENIVFISQLR